MAVSTALRIAMEMALNPYKDVIDDLINDISCSPEMANRKEYLDRVDKINQERNHIEIINYMRCVIHTLYIESEELCEIDVAKLAVTDGQAGNIGLDARAKTAVAALLINTLKKLYGESLLSML